jgi:hypothetical protein
MDISEPIGVASHIANVQAIRDAASGIAGSVPQLAAQPPAPIMTVGLQEVLDQIAQVRAQVERLQTSVDDLGRNLQSHQELVRVQLCNVRLNLNQPFIVPADALPGFPLAQTPNIAHLGHMTG